MRDLVSRQAAIDALSHMCSEDENGITVSRANVNSMLRVLPSAQPEQHWIPCSERLPDKEGAYIVTDDVGGASCIIFDAFFYCDEGKPTWLLSQNAKAWMKLPEPYKEDEK